MLTCGVKYCKIVGKDMAFRNKKVYIVMKIKVLAIILCLLTFALSCSVPKIAQEDEGGFSSYNALSYETSEAASEITFSELMSEIAAINPDMASSESGVSYMATTSADTAKNNTASKNVASSKVSVKTSSTAKKTSSSKTSSVAPSDKNVLQTLGELRGVWIAFYELGFANKSKEYFIEEMTLRLKKMKAMGLNAVFFHARSHSDAFYQSSYFPWSNYISGQQGKSPGYDPLAIMCDLAHKEGMQLHAWVNPYRIVTNSVVADMNKLDSNNPGRKWFEDGSGDVLRLPDGKGLYYDPSSKRSRELIVNGIKEIINKYNVDGIHFDDYFYPSSDMKFDEISYNKFKANPDAFYGINFSSAKYKNCLDGAKLQTMTQNEWRRTNINILVADVYAAVKAKSSKLVFGISPAGNITNNHDKLGLDVSKYLSTSGFVDYMMPQIYFGFKHPLNYAKFNVMLDDWKKMNTNKNVLLYIGLAFYKAGGASESNVLAKTEWQEEHDIIMRQVHLIKDTYKTHSQLKGFVFFAYTELFSSEECFTLERENLLKVINK